MTERIVRKLPPRWAYYALSLTWGLPLTLLGGLVTCALIVGGRRPKHFGHCLYTEVGEGWGGLEGGIFFITCRNPSERLLRHEHGHGLQNLVWGPLMLPCVTIPSAIRWHYRRHRECHGLELRRPYGAIWFEREADRLGELVAVS